MCFFVYRDADGQFRWRLRADNHEIIASSEGYHNKADCEESVRLIQAGASRAMVIDMTLKA